MFPLHRQDSCVTGLAVTGMDSVNPLPSNATFAEYVVHLPNLAQLELRPPCTDVTLQDLILVTATYSPDLSTY